MKLHQFRKRFAILLAALLLLPCFALTAFAYEAVDTGREASLTVYFGDGENDFSGVEFRVYRVADISETGEMTLAGDFAAYPVSLEELDSSGWRALAQTVDAYIARDGLLPLREAGTGESGEAVFEGLPVGLYLITGDSYESGEYTYTPEPFFICLPDWDEEDGQWNYDMSVSCKFDSRQVPPTENTVRRKVMKIWKDDGNEQKRPEEITVQLLRDGTVYDTVTLDESNNWRYEWTDLDEDSRWQVAEYETPEDYTVSVSREGITFVMTNTYQPDTPDTPGTPDTPDTPDTPSSPRLPQTGMLWWPVPLLAFGGILLFLIGWGKRRNEDNRQED